MARLALTGATLMTATRGNIENGTLLIHNSTIAEIGAHVRIPQDAEGWDLKGKVVIPGMIDAHTHLGLRQDGVGAEQSDEDEVENPIVPQIRAIDAINPEDIGFSDALRRGYYRRRDAWQLQCRLRPARSGKSRR
jgi:imidazolonepropionase-like amidohydrolase